MARTTALLDQLISKYESRLGQSLPSCPKEKVLEPVPSCPKEKVSEPIISEKSVHEEHKISDIDQSQAPYDLFPHIDIRIGRIAECWRHPSSDNLYCERVDVGEGSLREIGTGLQQSVPIEDMSGIICVMANLKPRKLGGFLSNGMVMAQHTPNGFELIRPGNLIPGERVGLEGVVEPGTCPMLPIMNPKKKILEKSIAFFHSDAEGYFCFGMKKLVTSAGFIKTNHANSKIS